jgi:dolichol-phosphate mannosyltransferase
MEGAFRSLNRNVYQPLKPIRTSLLYVDNFEAGSKALPNASIVVPVRNEVENITPLLTELRQTLAGLSSFGLFEIIYVDDGSVDATQDVLKSVSENYPELVILCHNVAYGQSAAIRTGVMAARAPLIITIDGDGQNDPADIPKILDAYIKSQDRENLMVTGHRVQRRDVWVKRISSRIANLVRSILLGDATPDTGCGLKIISRKAFLSMPAFNHMHRFLPALMIGQGGHVVSIKVNHRPRERGKSNYGVIDRLFVGIIDLLGVLWLKHRALKINYVSEKELNKDKIQ